tara:strand:+ start:22 stop:1137 length:1116 start_codon:yes stop_codon:yes gene_type:complete
LEEINQLIQSLKISDDDKEQLFLAVKAIHKQVVSFEFKFKRTVSDKTAITNILNASIEEIEKQKKIIEDTKDELNKSLFEMDQQNKLIEEKNDKLNQLLNDLKETQQQLVMSEKMASLGQLTAGVAHEINNPINFVSANIKPLKEDLNDVLECLNLYESVIKECHLEHKFIKVNQYKKDSSLEISLVEIQELIKGIEEGAHRTTEIVKGLRNFSRLDQNLLKKADVNEGIASTLILLHSTLKDKIEIKTQYGIIPKIECFPGELNQVFMNITANAIQAIPQKGEILIKTWTENNTVKISIKDNGLGMSDQTLNKIFEPFFTTKDVGKGTGLGLSISYGIIKKHQGKIEVNSKINKGTEFKITLPINQNKDF